MFCMDQQSEQVRRLLTDELGECCESDLQQRLDELRSLAASTDETTIERDSAVCKTLGNETRMRLLRYLDAVDRQLCVCELNELADVSTSAISHALSDLGDAGLVTREKQGKWRYYEPTARGERLLATLDATREPTADGGEAA